MLLWAPSVLPVVLLLATVGHSGAGPPQSAAAPSHDQLVAAAETIVNGSRELGFTPSDCILCLRDTKNVSQCVIPCDGVITIRTDIENIPKKSTQLLQEVITNSQDAYGTKNHNVANSRGGITKKTHSRQQMNGTDGRIARGRQTTLPPLSGPGHDDPRRAQKLITTDASQQNQRVFALTTDPDFVDQIFPSSHNVFTKLARKLDSRKSSKESSRDGVTWDKRVETPTSHLLSIGATDNVKFITDHKLFYKRLPASVFECPWIEEIMKNAANECSNSCIGKKSHYNLREEAACFGGCYSQFSFKCENLDKHAKTHRHLKEKSDTQERPGVGVFSKMENMISSMSGKVGQMMRGAWKRISSSRPDPRNLPTIENSISVVHISDSNHENEPRITIQVAENSGKPRFDIQPVGFEVFMKSFDNSESHPFKLMDSVMGKKLLGKAHDPFMENDIFPFMNGFLDEGFRPQQFVHFEHLPSMTFRNRPRFHLSLPEFERNKKHELNSEMSRQRDLNHEKFAKWLRSDANRTPNVKSNIGDVSNKDLLSQLKAPGPPKESNDESRVNKKEIKVQYLDLLECISRKSGMPRWMIVSALLVVALVLLWLCASLAVSVEERGGKCEESVALLEEEEDILEAPSLPEKRGVPVDETLQVVA